MPRIRQPVFPELEKQILMHGIKKKDIAVLLDISTHALSNKLTGRVDFTFSEIEKIAALFPDMHWEALFERTKNEQGDGNTPLNDD